MGGFRIREHWAEAVSTLKDRLDDRIHKISDKAEKSENDEQLEKSLMDQKKCVVDELNKVLVPTEQTRLSAMPTPGAETRVPVIFLNTAELDLGDSLTELEEFLPVVGEDRLLVGEQQDQFLDLPIIGGDAALMAYFLCSCAFQLEYL